MATYAAFKHVELHKVGFGKNRVPNAPRGCISEIFNGPDGSSRRHANGNGTSNGNGVSSVDSPAKTPLRPRDTHSRLFGGPLPLPPPSVRNDTTRSHIQFGDVTDAPQSRASPSQTNGHINGVTNGHVASPKKEGNPVTGDGYKSINSEINTTVTALNGNAMPINHNRIPPGGYSSGLW